ncbi:hypothetical protein BpHYR1_047999 [Brachionus plicatilis]|uniref:Uncharacterized protein n=1 Tax=Brachionus plicatilis TaxID=10195 RepID=A0A3M7TA11_BRAPC|nr:hypothetical protein BpHYR1_047999 [Brachionus plicatilis]
MCTCSKKTIDHLLNFDKIKNSTLKIFRLDYPAQQQTHRGAVVKITSDPCAELNPLPELINEASLI